MIFMIQEEAADEFLRESELPVWHILRDDYREL